MQRYLALILVILLNSIKNRLTKILIGNKLFGHYDDGVYQGPVEEIHYQNGDYEIIADGTTYRGKWKTINNQICYKTERLDSVRMCFSICRI